MKRLSFILSILAVLVFMMIFPEDSLAASKRGLMLWFEVLLPSLLPFIILSSFLIRTNIILKILGIFPRLWKFLFGLSSYGAYALILGIFCGYPMGSKLTADLCDSGRISRSEAEYLLTISNNASPSFVSTYIIIETLQVQTMMIPTFVILYLSNFLCSLIFRFYYGRRVTALAVSVNQKEASTPVPLMELIDTSIMNGFESMAKLGGYIILFSILAGLTLKLTFLGQNLRYILLGMLEITNGIQYIASAPWSFSWIYTTIMAVTAFGGFSSVAQTKCMIRNANLSINVYIAAKLCNGCITVILCRLFFLFKIIS